MAKPNLFNPSKILIRRVFSHDSSENQKHLNSRLINKLNIVYVNAIQQFKYNI